MIVVNIARDFTRFPSGRSKLKGDTSGEAFREKFLETPIREGKEITVELDGTIGYGSSFLEEAFGGLIRSLNIPPIRLLEILHVTSSDPTLVDEVQGYILDAQKRKP